MLTDEQWRKIEPLLPKRRKNPKGGRPPADDRLCLEGILWILRTGARWKDLPAIYPDPSTCWRRLRGWGEDEGTQGHVASLSLRARRAGHPQLGRGICRRNVCAGKKRGAAVGKTKRGKGTKYLVVVDGQGIPLGSHTDSASPAEVRLLDKVMADIRVPKKGPGRPRTNPTRVIGDKGYDSKLARNCMRQKGVNLLVPYRKNNKNVNRQDDRLWDRYRRRYIVERTFAWMGTFRRLIIRYENHISMFVAFLQLAFAFITMRKCL